MDAGLSDNVTLKTSSLLIDHGSFNINRIGKSDDKFLLTKI